MVVGRREMGVGRREMGVGRRETGAGRREMVVGRRGVWSFGRVDVPFQPFSSCLLSHSGLAGYPARP